jgi:hypothetical protein
MAEMQGKVSKPPTAAAVAPVTPEVNQPVSGGGGTTAGGKWWVISTGGETRVTPFEVLESAKKPAGSVAGPFGTKAEAQGWITAKEKKFPIDVPNPLSGIGAVAHWIGTVVEHLTDGAMWRSLGWMGLGAALVMAGIYLWFRTSSTYKGLESAVVGTAKAL